MHSFSFPYFRNFFTRFGRFRWLIAGLLCGLIVYFFSSAPLLFAEEKKPFDPTTLHQEKDLSNLMQTYHQEMNFLFNDSISVLMQIFLSNHDLTSQTAKDALEKQLSPPDQNNENICFVTGKELNVSSYCLVRRGDFLLENYKLALENLRGTLSKSVSDSGFESQAEDQIGAVNVAAFRQQLIDEEILNAEKTFYSALSAYQELQIAFPLHREFEETKTQLIHYRDRLVEARKQIDTFPKRFINATTSYCE